jgi:hypothetical protein
MGRIRNSWTFPEISKFLLDIPHPICLRFDLKEKPWD